MKVYREITPLKEKDVYVVLDSINKGFDYPIHNHPEYELNLVIGISGSRIVGDVTEPYYDSDLVLLGPYLYHKWTGDENTLQDKASYRVITIQFGPDLFNSQLLQKEHCYKIRRMLEGSRRGIKYYGETINQATNMMIKLTQSSGFKGVIDFLSLLDLLSNSNEFVYLASEGFNPDYSQSDSKRIQSVHAYILKHFTNSNIKIKDVAKRINMSESAFSHFFKKYTNKNFTQFVIDTRIGYACKLLLDTNESVKEICFKSGFNNLANFNRLFKKHRNSTPVQFRQHYKEKNNFDWTTQITPYQFLPDKSKIRNKLKPEQFATKLFHN